MGAWNQGRDRDERRSRAAVLLVSAAARLPVEVVDAPPPPPMPADALRLLHRALADAGIDPADTLLTCAPRPPVGPARLDMDAVLPWLQPELARCQPAAVVTLGVVATKMLLGCGLRSARSAGIVRGSCLAPAVLATVHPAWIARRDGIARATAYAAFVRDLAALGEWLPTVGVLVPG